MDLDNNEVSTSTTVTQKAERLNHLAVAAPTVAELQEKAMREVSAAMRDMVLNTASNLTPAEQAELDTHEQINEQDQDSLEPNQRKAAKALRKPQAKR